MEPRVADFGISLNMPIRNVIPGFNPQTDEYSAPEMLVGSPQYDTRIDVWSYGVIFARLLTGERIQAHSEIQDEQERTFHRLFTMMRRFDRSNECHGPYGFGRPCFDARAFEELFGTGLSNECADLLNKIFNPNPIARLSAMNIIGHDFFDELFNDPFYQHELDLLGFE